jgi:hypothetical protein
MTVMYFKPTPEQVAAAKASDCPMATPRDPRDCQGRVCTSWDRQRDKPCAAHLPKD